MFYCSNTDKFFTPEEKGWYIQFSTDSGDKGAIKVNREPIDKEDAIKMLMDINSYEIWDVEFWSEVK